MNPIEITVIEPHGRVDAAGARPLEEELKQHIAAHRVRLLVCLKDTRYISSNGLRVLLAGHKEAKRHGGTLKICCLHPRLKEIFEMSGFDRVFEIYETREEAEQSFSA